MEVYSCPVQLHSIIRETCYKQQCPGAQTFPGIHGVQSKMPSIDQLKHQHSSFVGQTITCTHGRGWPTSWQETRLTICLCHILCATYLSPLYPVYEPMLHYYHTFVSLSWETISLYTCFVHYLCTPYYLECVHSVDMCTVI